jgi:imidazolonepropionase-like amidohydrolase
LARAGTVREGKEADLIMVKANPLKDIRNLRLMSGIILKGQWISAHNLQETLTRLSKDFK